MSNSETNYFLTKMRGLLCRPKPATAKEIYAFFHLESAKRQQVQLKNHSEVLELIRKHQSILGVNWTDPEKIIARDAGIRALADLERDIRAQVTGNDAEQLLLIHKLVNLSGPTNAL